MICKPKKSPSIIKEQCTTSYKEALHSVQISTSTACIDSLNWRYADYLSADEEEVLNHFREPRQTVIETSLSAHPTATT